MSEKHNYYQEKYETMPLDELRANGSSSRCVTSMKM